MRYSSPSHLLAAAVAIVIACGSRIAIATPPPATGSGASPSPTASSDGVRAPRRAYGWQLMTEQERAEYHARMGALKTPEERERFRLEHHELMKARAKERGLTLPDAPHPPGGPASGSGKGTGRPNPGGGTG